MSEPFGTPPPLSDDIATRSATRATRLKRRRRAGIVGSALVILVVLTSASLAAQSSNNQGAQVHVAGVPDGQQSHVSNSPSHNAKVTRSTRLATTTSSPVPTPHGTTTVESSGTSAKRPNAQGLPNPPNQGHGPATTTPSTLTGQDGPPSSNNPATTTTLNGSSDQYGMCPTGPVGTITFTATVTAQNIAPGKWYLNGTMKIVNHSQYEYASQGVVYVSNTTIPGGTGEAWLGWGGTQTVFVGSGASFGGFTITPPGQTVTLPLEQELHIDGGANALSSGSTPPTTIHQGLITGTVGHPLNKICANLPSSAENFSIGGQYPN